MAGFMILPMHIDNIPATDYGNEGYVEIHLDERFYMGEDMHLCKVWMKEGHEYSIIEKEYKLFHDADQCIDFISSYQWKQIFLTLTDHFSYLLDLIHNLPQIVYFYIYSAAPQFVSYKKEQYEKLRAIVQENSPEADKPLLDDIKIFKRDLMPMNVVKPVKRKVKLLIQEAFNIHEYGVVWLQDDKNNITVDTSPISDIIKSLKIYFNESEAIDFIESSREKKLFFITSNLNLNTIIGKVSDYSQVIAIYILQTQLNSTNDQNLSCAKVHGVYHSIQDLSADLSKEYERQLKYSEMPMSVFQRDKNVRTVRDLGKANARFLWFQLVIDILISIPYNDQAKDEMLFECRKHYGIPCGDDDDETETNVVDSSKSNYIKNKEQEIIDFETNYKSTEALRFYTNDSFLYRLFNQAFRTENIDLLFIFRFFLADMYKHLQKLYAEQFPSALPSTVFRGQIMTNQEFDSIKNNIGLLISINTFFSTTVDRDVAGSFSSYGIGLDVDHVSVLFQIEVDVAHSTSKRPFASISAFSKFPDEQETVFSVGSMFRIEYVEDRRMIEGHWYVKLKLVEDDGDIRELRTALERTYCDKSDLCTLGTVLRHMGDYQRAERFFLMLLEYTPEDHPNMDRIYSLLGTIARDQGNHQTSLNYHEKALQLLKKRKFAADEEMIGRQYVDIGASHHGLGNLELAVKYYTMATEIQKSPHSLSYTYNQIGLLYQEKGDYRLALEYFQKTLHIEEQILQTNKYGPVLATMYNNIGDTYDRLGETENALKYLHHALDIRLKGTVPTHTDLAAIYCNLGKVYQKKGELNKALEFLEKALEINTQTFGQNHESLAPTHSNIALVYLDMNDSKKAIYHAETALRILLRSQAGESHMDVSRIQYNIGMIQFQLGSHIKALKITHKALQNHLKRFSKNDRLFAHIYLLLSKIYQKEQDKATALEYMEKAMEIARVSILPHDKSTFQTFQAHLDSLKNNEYGSTAELEHISINMYGAPDSSDQQDYVLSNALDQLSETSSDNIMKRLKLLNTIAALYSKKENYQMAMKHLDDAVDLHLQNQSSNRFSALDLEMQMILIYFSGSRVYYRQSDWTMSFKNLETALSLALRQKLEHPLLSEIYHAMGLCCKHQLDISMAIYYLELAITIATKRLPSDHSRIQVFRSNLEPLKSLLPLIRR